MNLKSLDRGHAALRPAIKTQIDRLMEICDGSNWPEYAQTGDGYKAYSEITEQLLEIIMNLQHTIAQD